MSAICPGQETLLPGKHPRYLCVPVIVYWNDSSPSHDDFYLHNYSLHPWTPDTRAALCLEMQARIRAMTINGDARVGEVNYQGYYAIELSDEQVRAYSQRLRFIDGTQPMYAPGSNPNPKHPTPEPAPEPAPAPVHVPKEVPEEVVAESVQSVIAAGSAKR